MCNVGLPLVYQLVGLGHHHADPARGPTMTPVRWNSPKGPPSYGPTIPPPGQSSKGLPTEPGPAPDAQGRCTTNLKGARQLKSSSICSYCAFDNLKL